MRDYAPILRQKEEINQHLLELKNRVSVYLFFITFIACCSLLFIK